jgi:hypothetical protein
MSENKAQTNVTPGKGARERSPSFPFISLKVAIERLVAFEEHYKRTPASAETVGAVWGMKVGSGNVAQTISALKAFGLLEAQRGASGLEITISDDGRTYLRAQQESIRREVAKRIALNPKQIRSHWEKWGAERPKDAACLDDLVLKEAFTQDGAVTFLRVYDATIAYAGLVNGDKTESKLEEGSGDADLQKSARSDVQPKNKHEDQENRPKAKAGDWVLWCADGVDQFSTPRQVNWVSEDGSHARVHGSLTGIPMEELTIADPRKLPIVGTQTKRASSAYAGVDGELNVLLTGQRLQITADVDLAGVERLKEVLGHYETILKLLAS